ncbi:MAG: (d)CMP kinase [Planctomycetota bacterium]
MIVTLDGPAGAGKSTAARALATRLGWCYLDTGAMYRTVALVALEQGIPLDDSAALAGLAGSLAIDFRGGRVLVGDRDVSAEIRTERITQATRPVADAPPVRAAMKQLQRRLAEGRDVVTEGRDQGSEVFPWAEVKVFLTASADERARRRHLEEAGRGVTTSLESVRAAQARRDEGDRVRPVGAMQPAADAVILETDGLSADEVVERLAALVAGTRSREATP